MKIEGTIEEVMETWPLQLTLASDQGRFHVLLRPETAIRKNDVGVGASELRRGEAVRVEGHASGAAGLTATAVTVLDRGASSGSTPAAVPEAEVAPRGENEAPVREVPAVEMPPPDGED
jgi:hypothetical protein